MNVLGIDPGFRSANPCGVAILDTTTDKLVFFAAYSPPARATWIEAVGLVSIWISGVAGTWRPRIVGFELPSAHVNIASSLKLTLICGAAVNVATAQGATFVPLQPSEVKRDLTGDGSADKAAMIRAVLQQFGVTVEKDIADAVGVAVSAAAKLRWAQLDARAVSS